MAPYASRSISRQKVVPSAFFLFATCERCLTRFRNETSKDRNLTAKKSDDLGEGDDDNDNDDVASVRRETDALTSGRPDESEEVDDIRQGGSTRSKGSNRAWMMGWEV